MLRNQWNQTTLKQCKDKTGQVLHNEKQKLAMANQDFGRLVSGEAAAVLCPQNIPAAQSIIQFASQHKLPLTVRANGLSQSGQSLAPAGATVLDISQINDKIYWRDGKLIAGCSATWKSIISKSLEQNSLPPVIPYNTGLTLGGVLSVGGLGSSSFIDGAVVAHIDELLVLTAAGEIVSCNREKKPDLFEACLSGAGLFGIIIEASLNVRPCRPHVRVYTLIYDNYNLWLDDQFTLKAQGDYLEAFIADNPDMPSGKSCIINVAIEYDDIPPALDVNLLNHVTIDSMVDESILEYTYRHDPRIQGMRESGAWDKYHPWYECFVDRYALQDVLDKIIPVLDKNIGGIYRVFPVAPKVSRYFMLPETENAVMFNVLSPGVESRDVDKAIDALLAVNDMLLELGGKRYISGWFPHETRNDYWLTHYGDLYDERRAIKLKYDPDQIFCSQLFPAL